MNEGGGERRGRQKEGEMKGKKRRKEGKGGGR